MIHVQKGGVGAFEDDALSFPGIIEKQEGRVIDIWLHSAAEVAIGFENRLPIEGGAAAEDLQDLVSLGDDAVDSMFEAFLIGQIGDANGR